MIIKYQKLELESLIKEAKERERKLNETMNHCIDKIQISSVLNQLSDLESSKLEFGTENTSKYTDY